MSKEKFYLGHVIKATSVKRERLFSWIKWGFIKPEMPAQGQGYPAEYSRIDLYKIGLFKELIKYGFTRKLAGRLISKINFNKPEIILKINMEKLKKEIDSKI